MEELPLGMIAKWILQTYPMYLIHFLFWIIMLLVFSQYNKMVKRERELFGTAKNNPLRQTLISTGFGFLAGIMASFIIIILGINLMAVGVVYVLPFVILMMLIHPRYMCFAYGGGIVGLLSLSLSALSNVWPVLNEISFLQGLMAINVPGLISLIAILHLTEAVLILFSGAIGSSPLYVKHETKGIVGGFSLQKFWPLPFVGLISQPPGENGAQAAETAISMPEWWPIFGSGLEEMAGGLAMFPVVAVLGYGDISVSTPPGQKSKEAGKNLALYSIVLLGVALAAAFYLPLAWLSALLSPVGHEIMIIKGKSKEFSREPIYYDNNKGIKILDIYPDGIASNMGLKPGDRIHLINHFPVSTEEDFRTMLYSGQPHLRLDIERENGERKVLQAPIHDDKTRFGVILAPGVNKTRSRYMELAENDGLKALSKRFKFFGRLFKRNRS